ISHEHPGSGDERGKLDGIQVLTEDGRGNLRGSGGSLRDLCFISSDDKRGGKSPVVEAARELTETFFRPPLRPAEGRSRCKQGESAAVEAACVQDVLRPLGRSLRQRQAGRLHVRFDPSGAQETIVVT